MAHVGTPSTSVHPRPIDPPYPHTSSTDYDQLVKVTVRRAWDRAWQDYQTGKWRSGAPDMSSATPPVTDSAVLSGSSGAGATHATAGALSAASGSSPVPVPPEPREYYDATLEEHPHLPADNRRQALPYGLQASMRRRAAAAGDPKQGQRRSERSAVGPSRGRAASAQLQQGVTRGRF